LTRKLLTSAILYKFNTETEREELRKSEKTEKRRWSDDLKPNQKVGNTRNGSGLLAKLASRHPLIDVFD
jgi:hypothetical protein